MKKSDLKNGMIAVFEDGRTGVFLVDTFVTLSDGGTVTKYFTDDLRRIGGGTEIKSLYEITEGSLCGGLNYWFRHETILDRCTKIWQRKPDPIEMTLAQVCEELGKDIKIIK